jgi:hypothetical protein
VEVALRGTRDARGRTSFEHRSHQAEIRHGLPRHDSASGVALVGAVIAESDDAQHLGHVGLAQARVGARRTTGGAIETLIDTPQERLAVHLAGAWMEFDDLAKGHGLSSRRNRAVTLTGGCVTNSLEATNQEAGSASILVLSIDAF